MALTPEWARVVGTTTHEFIREEELNVLRNRKLLALLKSRGRITMNHAGDAMDWKIRYKRAPMTGYADGDVLTFSRQDRWKTAQLEWRGYSATDSMTKKEKLMNKDTEAIIKIYSQVASSLMDDIDDQFGEELYVDGNASGNSKKIHGFESWFGTSGASTKMPVGLPSDTYAQLTTGLGDYSGSWTTTGTTTTATDWPGGVGDSHYDFNSPLIVDVTSAVATSAAAGTKGWQATTKTWPNTCTQAMRFGLTYSRKNKSRKGQVDLILLNNEMYRDFLDQQDTKERVTIDKGSTLSGDRANLVSLGFADVTYFDGCEVTSEYGLAPNVGYGLSVSQMELCSLQGSLFAPDGPDFDIATKSWRYSIDFFGNLRANVRNQIRFKNVS